jgi:hypothetical protein
MGTLPPKESPDNVILGDYFMTLFSFWALRYITDLHQAKALFKFVLLQLKVRNKAIPWNRP